MPLLTDFKAALFDVDGTLTTSGREVRPTTRQALKLLQKKGLICGFCTGKHYGKLVQENLIDVLPKSARHVLSGGTQVVDGRGQILWQIQFPVGVAEKILAQADTDRVVCFIKHSFYLYGNDQMFTFARQKHEGIISILKPISPEAFTGVLSVGLVDPTAEFVAKIAKIPGITLNHNVANHTHFVDITALGVTKATGISQWSRITHIPTQQIIGFGDSQNDWDFLQAVGFAVVLGNAVDEIKTLADRVIGHTDDDGVAKYVTKICTSGQL